MSNTHRDMINRLIDLEDDELTAWEAEFVDSLSKLQPGVELSDKQINTLERIFDRVG